MSGINQLINISAVGHVIFPVTGHKPEESHANTITSRGGFHKTSLVLTHTGDKVL